MDNFDNFMIHKVKAEYQNNGFSVNFGGGYSFDTDGGYPPLRKFTLTFTGYQFYTKEVNGIEVVDREKNADINNIAALEDFYKAHLSHQTFVYNSPQFGKAYVRFAEPLIIPKGIPSGHGVLEDFDVVLKEVFA